MLPTLTWLLTVVGLGVAVLPLTMCVLAGLPDRGYGLSRIVGLVVVGWLAYLSAMLSFTAYVSLTVGLIVLGVGAASWVAWGRETLAELRARKRLLVAEEATFVAVFALGTFVRAYNADIIGQ